jgi:hypothetical protein
MKQPLERSQVVTLAALSVLIAVLAVAFFLSGREDVVQPAPSTVKDLAPLPPPEVPAKRSVVLLFASENDGLLHPEEREIEAGPTPAQEAGRLLEEMIRGSRTGLISTFPPETKVRQVYFTREGTAYVDFSKDLSANHPSGSDAEMATVYAVVDSLAYNFKEVKRVLILIEGQEEDSLDGHVALDKALLPYYPLVAQ